MAFDDSAAAEPQAIDAQASSNGNGTNGNGSTNNGNGKGLSTAATINTYARQGVADADAQGSQGDGALVDREQVLRFLQLLGRVDERLVLALFPPDPAAPMLHMPQASSSEIAWADIERTLKRKASDQLSLGLVINRCGDQPADWGTNPDHFSGKRPSDREHKCKIWSGEVEGEKRRNRPKTWGASNNHISEAVAVWFECDGGLSIQEQERLHSVIGLPEPTFTVWTGGKSLHCYYVLSEPISGEQFRFLMDWICRALKGACPDAGADASLKNPSRIMRCPGGIHGTKGGRAYIHSEHPEGKRYSAKELEQALPEQAKPSAQAKAAPKTAKGLQPGQAPKKGQSRRHRWFRSLPEGEQWGEALLMLAVIPCRQQPSAEGGPEGTREPALKVLGGLASHFGDERAATLCEEAGWVNQWWKPAVELESFTHEHLEIVHVIDAAIQHGYLSPSDRRRAEVRARANRGDGINPPLTGEWPKTFDWMLTQERTVEIVVEEALTAQTAESGSKLWCYQGTFRRYDPALGWYRRISHDDLTREITALLRRVYELQRIQGEDVVVRKMTTAAKANACCEWMARVTALKTDMDLGRRIAFANGTAFHDGEKWVLGTHSPDHLLSYGISGDWVDAAPCPPLFHEFIRTSYGLQWLQIIRAVLSYTADPAGTCRILLFLIGASGSGKGTLERLMEQMFPPETVSMITQTAKLDSPEGVAQFIAGRRLLVMPELQGHQRGLGVLYSLTEAGLLSGRRLFSTEIFEFRFTGRVVICSTQAPTFDNAGTGAVRRFLTIPTLPKPLPSDLLPSNSDEFNAALAAEIGQLVSWALQMPADEVEQVLQKNDPEGLLREALADMEVHLDGTRQFIDACLVPAPAGVVPSEAELFMAYQLFSRHRGLKVCNQDNFIGRLKGAMGHLHRPRRMVNGVRVRAGFYGVQLAPGLWHGTEAPALEALRAAYRKQGETGDGRTSFSGYGWETTDLVTSPGKEKLGWLVVPNLMEGQLALLRAHRP